MSHVVPFEFNFSFNYQHNSEIFPWVLTTSAQENTAPAPKAPSTSCLSVPVPFGNGHTARAVTSHGILACDGGTRRSSRDTGRVTGPGASPSRGLLGAALPGPRSGAAATSRRVPTRWSDKPSLEPPAGEPRSPRCPQSRLRRVPVAGGSEGGPRQRPAPFPHLHPLCRGDSAGSPRYAVLTPLAGAQRGCRGVESMLCHVGVGFSWCCGHLHFAV